MTFGRMHGTLKFSSFTRTFCFAVWTNFPKFLFNQVDLVRMTKLLIIPILTFIKLTCCTLNWRMGRKENIIIVIANNTLFVHFISWIMFIFNSTIRQINLIRKAIDFFIYYYYYRSYDIFKWFLKNEEEKGDWTIASHIKCHTFNHWDKSIYWKNINFCTLYFKPKITLWSPYYKWS